MHRFTATSLLTLGLLALSSCTAIQDVSQFQEDFSCSVDIGLRDFFPHAQQPGPMDISDQSQRRERFGIYVVEGRREASGLFRREYSARAFFDPLPAVDIDVRLPFAVEASETGDVLPASLELHADRQTLRSGADFFEISPIPSDHSWIFPHACSEEGTVFTHVTEFDQLEPADDLAFGLKIEPKDNLQFWVDNTLEIRVVTEAIVDEVEVDRARAFYRRAGATDIETATDDDAELDVGGVLREDEDVSVIVFVDRNGNGIYDSSPLMDEQDIAFEIGIEFGEEGVGRCVDPEMVTDVCFEGDDIRVPVTMRDLMNNDSTLIDGPWWTRIER